MSKKRDYFNGIATGIILSLLVILVIILIGWVKPVLRSDIAAGMLGKSTDTHSGADKPVDFEVKTDQILEVLEENYLEPLDRQQMYEQAIKGLVDGVGDPYTNYFSKQEYEKFIEAMQGSYDGIGAVISYGKDKEEIIIVAPFKGSPAEVAGLQPKDRIIRVDDQSIVGMDIDQAIALIKGPKNTEVRLTVVRQEKTQQIKVIRDTITVPTVDYEMLEDSIGYIAVSGFDEVTAKQFEQAMDDLEARKAKGLIIDLRNNPGGYLHIVVQMVDRLLPKGKMIVYTEDRKGEREELRTETDQFFDKPLVVLINGNSASASEIMAGAIKDHKIGKLVGETTFGKGLVQRSFEMEDGSAIKITISKYFTPNGHYINEVGIKPDVEVEWQLEQPVEGEADGTAEANSGAETGTDQKPIDHQLEKAIEVLSEMIDSLT